MGLIYEGLIKEREDLFLVAVSYFKNYQENLKIEGEFENKKGLLADLFKKFSEAESVVKHRLGSIISCVARYLDKDIFLKLEIDSLYKISELSFCIERIFSSQPQQKTEHPLLKYKNILPFFNRDILLEDAYQFGRIIFCIIIEGLLLSWIRMVDGFEKKIPILFSDLCDGGVNFLSKRDNISKKDNYFINLVHALKKSKSLFLLNEKEELTDFFSEHHEELSILWLKFTKEMKFNHMDECDKILDGIVRKIKNDK